ncbi:MAG: ABC transporter substrate-binding protein [Proteobacteria bacterium]|nr:ABC transporter substrate-binding protein [Pseudomonadota bacterium]
MRAATWRLLALMLAGPALAAPARIVSINMCTDQLLVDLAAPGQIAGLSPYAHDGARSWIAGRATGIPALSGSAEEVLVMRPDLVLAGSFTRRATRTMLREKGIRIEEFPLASTIEEAKKEIRRAGSLLGNEQGAERRIAEIDAALLRLRAAATKTRLRVLPYSRRGWVSGRRSLVSDLLAQAGLANAAADLGLASGGFVPLEALVALKPDALLVARDDGRAEDQGRAMLLHPAVAALFPPERQIVIPEMLTICAGPMLPEAMDRLAAQIEKLASR